MPYTSEKKLLKRNQDRRIKLTDEQREDIKKIRATTTLSQRKIAEMYGVSRRTIQFIINPQSLIENKKRRAERGGTKIYYDTKKNTIAQREHRAYKQGLYLKGEL
tara:strand:- start:20769 stop:21083 length:315 start_codon:yes stop_codon:yes gene_type:complete